MAMITLTANFGLCDEKSTALAKLGRPHVSLDLQKWNLHHAVVFLEKKTGIWEPYSSLAQRLNLWSMAHWQEPC